MLIAYNPHLKCVSMHPKAKELSPEAYLKWSLQEKEKYESLHGHREMTATREEIEKCEICNPKKKKRK